MRIAIVFMMTMLTMVSYINRTSMSIAGPSIMKEFGFSATEMGSIYSAFLFSYAILMIPGGALADRYGPRIVLGLTGLAAAGATALAALVGSPILPVISAIATFQLIRLLVGTCSAPLFPGCARLSGNWFDPSQRARVTAIMAAGAPLGAAITPVLVAWLVAQYGWRPSLCLVAILAGAASLIWLTVVRDGPATAAAVPVARIRFAAMLRLLQDRNLLVLSAGYFALNYFEYIFFYWIYYYFGEVRHMPAQQSAVYSTILLLTMMAGMPVGGWISDMLHSRFRVASSRHWVASGSMVASAILLILGVKAQSEGMIVTLLALAIGCCAAAEGPFWASAVDAGGTEAGAATGVMNGFGNLGGLIAPVLTPFLAQRAGWSAGLYFASAVVLVGMLSWLFYKQTSPVEIERAVVG